MDPILVVVFIALVVIVIANILIYLRLSSKGEDSKGQSLLLQQLNELSRTVDQKLGQSAKDMQDSMRHQSTEAQRIIRDVTERLVRLDETNKQVISFADQLQNLQDVLKNPKQRGILGEYYLETLLKNVLPPGSFQMQYPFKDGTIVDAVVFVKDKVIPIDSKFSLENYNRIVEEKNESERVRLEKVFENDLKNRIIETSKYIKPSEGTMDFAFMFIPHEAIYYDLLVNKIGVLNEENENLIQRAAGKYKVIIVSPTSFLAYLQTVMQGLKAMQIEESAKEIRKNIDKLQKHIMSYDEYLHKLGQHLGTTVNTYNLAYKEFKKVDKDVYRITGKASGIDPELIEGPDRE